MNYPIIINQKPSLPVIDTEYDHIYIFVADTNLYTIDGVKVKYCKIGKAKDPYKRVKEVQTGCPFPLTIYKIHTVYKHQNAYDIEANLHQRMKKYRCSGEWFRILETDFEKFISTINSYLFHNSDIPRKKKIKHCPNYIKKARANKLKKAKREYYATHAS